MNSVVKLLIEVTGEVGAAILFTFGLRAVVSTVVIELLGTQDPTDIVYNQVSNILVRAMAFFILSFTVLIHTRL